MSSHEMVTSQVGYEAAGIPLLEGIPTTSHSEGRRSTKASSRTSRVTKATVRRVSTQTQGTFRSAEGAPQDEDNYSISSQVVVRGGIKVPRAPTLQHTAFQSRKELPSSKSTPKILSARARESAPTGEYSLHAAKIRQAKLAIVGESARTDITMGESDEHTPLIQPDQVVEPITPAQVSIPKKKKIRAPPPPTVETEKEKPTGLFG